MGYVKADDPDWAELEVVKGDGREWALERNPLPEDGVQELAIQPIDVVHRQHNGGDVDVVGALEVMDCLPQFPDRAIGNEDKHVDIAILPSRPPCARTVEDRRADGRFPGEHSLQGVDRAVNLWRVHRSASRQSRSTVSND